MKEKAGINLRNFVLLTVKFGNDRLHIHIHRRKSHGGHVTPNFPARGTLCADVPLKLLINMCLAQFLCEICVKIHL